MTQILLEASVALFSSQLEYIESRFQIQMVGNSLGGCDERDIKWQHRAVEKPESTVKCKNEDAHSQRHIETQKACPGVKLATM